MATGVNVVPKEVYEDPTVVDQDVLKASQQLKEALFDEFEPFKFDLANREHSKFFKLNLRHFKSLQRIYDFMYESEDNEIRIVALKQL